MNTAPTTCCNYNKNNMKELTKRQKNKIVIAEDVIAQIKAKKFIPTSGVYASFPINLTEGDDLQEKLAGLKRGQACEVCGIGSAFLSCVAIHDDYTVDEKDENYQIIDEDKMRKKLKEFFTVNELAVIEACFEVESGFLDRDGATVDPEELESSSGFVDILHEMDETERLLWIMQSVINLDGVITIDGFKQQMLLALAVDPKFKEYRSYISF